MGHYAVIKVHPALQRDALIIEHNQWLDKDSGGKSMGKCDKTQEKR